MSDPKVMAEAEFRKEFPSTQRLIDNGTGNLLRFDADDVHMAFVDGYLSGILAVRDLMKDEQKITAKVCTCKKDPSGIAGFIRDPKCPHSKPTE